MLTPFSIKKQEYVPEAMYYVYGLKELCKTIYMLLLFSNFLKY